MFRKLKHYSVARKNRRQLLKNLEEIKNEDLFELHPACYPYEAEKAAKGEDTKLLDNLFSAIKGLLVRFKK